MARLYLMYGIPASGKSTFAKQIEGAYRLNRDQLREMMFPWKKYNSSREKAVKEIQYTAARALLQSGRDVVIDDLNIHRVTRQRWFELAKEVNPKTRVIVVKMKTPINVAWDRNKGRDAIVPELDMRRLIATYKSEPVEEDNLKYYEIIEAVPVRKDLIEDESIDRQLVNIITSNTTIADKLGMILSRNIDYGSEQGGLISMKGVNKAIPEILLLFGIKSNK